MNTGRSAILRPKTFYKACWITTDNEEKACIEFKRIKGQNMVKDKEENDVFLAPSKFMLDMEQKKLSGATIPFYKRIQSRELDACISLTSEDFEASSNAGIRLHDIYLCSVLLVVNVIAKTLHHIPVHELIFFRASCFLFYHAGGTYENSEFILLGHQEELGS
jgi:hypothetical protein